MKNFSRGKSFDEDILLNSSRSLALQVRPAFAPFNAESILKKYRPQVDWLGLRCYEEITQQRGYRDQHPSANSVYLDRGLMIEVLVNGHFGYAATSDLSAAAIEYAFQKARRMTEVASKYKISQLSPDLRPTSVGQYRSPLYRNVDSMSLEEITTTLRLASEALKVSDKIVSTSATIGIIETEIRYLTSSGTDTLQQFLMTTNHFKATSKDGAETQRRSDNGDGRCLQIGLEQFDRDEIVNNCQRIGKEAVELLTAENCPTQTMDLILDPDHMFIQIHESIGHPLELDRILGDERNYAGWSFVRPEDFGTLQYGSKLLNVSFDPSYPGEFASYQFDDGGNPAKKEYLIKEGRLVRALGGLESQQRSGIPGVANFRATSWNRAPIDRMANINVEPGDSSLQEMISKVEKGILVKSNISWSIDDYRDKFQFGAEFAQLIEDGRITKTLKNPNYRGRTVSFWNSLKAVGNGEEMAIYGSPWCGKGEPSQVIRVGHGAPPCLFGNIDIFGGGQ